MVQIVEAYRSTKFKVKQVWTNANFLLTAASFSIFLYCINTEPTCIGEMLSPIGAFALGIFHYMAIRNTIALALNKKSVA